MKGWYLKRQVAFLTYVTRRWTAKAVLHFIIGQTVQMIKCCRHHETPLYVE